MKFRVSQCDIWIEQTIVLEWKEFAIDGRIGFCVFEMNITS